MTVIDGAVAPEHASEPVPHADGSGDAPPSPTLSQSHKWWTSKVGPLLGVTYVCLTIFPLSTATAVARLAALMWSACLLASVAYVVNDWSDREPDRRLGKQSFAMTMGPLTAAILMTAPVALAVIPWAYIGLPAAGWAALGAIVLLPHLYSDRPIRWKERGPLGLLADTMLAHFCPTAFALAAFGGFEFDQGAARAVVVLGLLVWSGAVGLRGIIDHQLSDLDADRISGTATWVLSVGVVPARGLAEQVLVVEILALATVFAGLTVAAPVTAAIVGVAAVGAALGRVTGVWDRPLLATSSGPVFGMLWVSYAFWLPLAALIGLVIVEPTLLPLVPLHVILFRTMAWRWVRNVVGYGRWTVRTLVAGAGTFLRYRIRDSVVRAFNWFRYRVPDYFRRAWYHGLRRGAHNTNMRVRHSVDSARSVKVHPWQNVRRQFRRVGRVWQRLVNRSIGRFDELRCPARGRGHRRLVLGPGATSRILAVTHEMSRTGAPLVLLRLLQWLKTENVADIEILALRDGAQRRQFEAVGPVHIVPVIDPTVWLAPKGSSSVERTPAQVRRLNATRVEAAKGKAANLLGFDALYLNSGSSARSLRLLPEIPPVVVAHLHELDSAFDRWLDPVDRELLLAKADLFVVAAHCVGQHLVDSYGVDPDLILRPPHEFIGPPIADPAGTVRARARLGLRGDETVIGAIGTADWRKGTDLFVQVADQVRRHLPTAPLRFVWIGGAHDLAMKPFLHDVTAYGLDDVVTFVGEVGDVPAWIGLFDMFCLTSREDPFPLVCLEAGALGVPVISFVNGGMAELAVADGPADPLLTIVDYADVEAMAAAVVDRVTDPEPRRREGDRLKRYLLENSLSGSGAADVAAVLDKLLTTSAGRDS